MPETLLRPCAAPGCHELVSAGRCASHRRHMEQRRGSASSRGYTEAWVRFRTWVFQELDRLAVAGTGDGAVCGARLPSASATTDSRCQLEGRVTTAHLHLDHFPPLTDAERRNARAVCDPARVQVLCESCHNAKTRRERAA